MRLRILNNYAGIGGNRGLWGDDHEIVAVEIDPSIAGIYQHFYPKDTVIVGDAHQYLLDHHAEFDFIWSSPPCPTHSRTNTSLYGHGVIRYPDMRLYQEIIFLRHFFKGKWVVENVKPYYEPLIKPTIEIDRHLFWTNFAVLPKEFEKRDTNWTRTRKEDLAKYHGIELPAGTKDQRKLLRNAVYPPLGEYIFNSSFAPQLIVAS